MLHSEHTNLRTPLVLGSLNNDGEDELVVHDGGGARALSPDSVTEKLHSSGLYRQANANSRELNTFLQEARVGYKPLIPAQLFWGFVSVGLILPIFYLAKRSVVVKENQLLYAEYNGHPVIIGPGRYYIYNPMVKMEEEKIYNRDDPETVFQAGPLTIVTVGYDEYGLATVDGQHIILGPGRHAYNNADFNFSKMVKQNEKLIRHGPIHIFNIPKGEAFATNKDGEMLILKEGRSVVIEPGLQIISRDSEQDKPFNLRKIVLTFTPIQVTQANSVKLSVTPVVEYNITNLDKLVVTGDVGNFSNAMRQLIIGAVNETVQAASLESLGSQEDRHQVFRGEGDTLVPSRNDIVKVLTPKLEEIFEPWGIEIDKVSIQEVSFDERTAELLKQQADAKASARAAEDNARKLQIDTNAQAAAKVAEAKGEAEAKIVGARAKADAAVIVAKGEGDAFQVKTEKEKQALDSMSSFQQDMHAVREKGPFIHPSNAQTVFYGAGKTPMGRLLAAQGLHASANQSQAVSPQQETIAIVAPTSSVT